MSMRFQPFNFDEIVNTAAMHRDAPGSGVGTGGAPAGAGAGPAAAGAGASGSSTGGGVKSACTSDLMN